MSEQVANLEPKAIWKNFAALNAVPRPSKKEEKVRAFMRSFLEELGLEYEQDEIGNILARKPATPGMADRQMVILQAHLDMVCQKNKSVDFNFEEEGIRMLVDGDWVTADGTTLGADNGIGVATIMAALASTDLPHPPLEALFTTDEEAGMTGAHHLQANFLQGDILMNLDTEDDEELSIGCAGGIDNNIDWQYQEIETPPNQRAYHLVIKGLNGGHSGMDIIQGRGNANKLLARLLYQTKEDFSASVAYLSGGGLRNAIPRESEALVSFPKDQQNNLHAHWDQIIEGLLKEFATTDPHLEISYHPADLPGKIMSPEDFDRLILAIQACHDGVKRLSPDVPNLVETSNSLASIEAKEGHFSAKTLTRSDRESAKYDMAHTVVAPFRLLGAQVKHSGSYPGWKLDPEAKMLGMMKALYQEMFEKEPKVIACHAGLECGLLGQHYPQLEMISFGPTIRDPHSPDERVQISSVQKFWTYFKEALQRIPKKEA